MKRLPTLLFALALLSAPALGEPGLQFEQAQRPAGGRSVAVRKAATAPLSMTDLSQLLSRLPRLGETVGERSDFALRPSSLPAAKAGERLAQPFPPPPSVQNTPAPGLEKKPVEVLRYGPQGEVDLAAQVSVTFNQPMVELSSTAAPTQVPVRLTPQVDGQWRWVGTQTLVFQPKNRLPMATSFRAEVQAAKPVSWTFATPPPQLKTSYPSGGKVRLKPVLFLAFNQRMDTRQVLSRLEFSGPSLRPATPEEVAADDQVKSLAKETQPGYWLAAVPGQSLNPATRYTLRVPPGVSSLEGPRTSTRDYPMSFETYRPLAIERSTPNPSPGAPLYVTFNNALQADQSVQLVASPEIAGLHARIHDGSLWIYGRTRGRTEYRLTLPAGLTDVFGQKLASPTVVEMHTAEARPMFTPPHQDFLVLDPHGPPQLNFTTVNHPRLSVQIRAVRPEDWPAYSKAMGKRWGGEFSLPGELLFDQEIEANTLEDEVQEVKLDLKRALETSHQLVVWAVPSDYQPKERSSRAYYGWVQRSQLGANLAADHDRLLVWVTRLADGSPVGGASVRYLPGQSQVETGTDGLARLPQKKGQRALVIRHGDDQLLVMAGSDFNVQDSPDPTLWYVTDDRKLYKPGETVSVKGWLRRQINRPKGQLEAIVDRPLTYQLWDARGNQLSRGQTSVGKLGGFDFEVHLPKDLHLDEARLDLTSDHSSHTHRFKVEEFRKPEFEVSSRAENSSVLIGETGSLGLEARYYAGGGLKNAPVRWDVEASPTRYSPPHWPEFTFGDWRPWWDCYAWWEDGKEPRPSKKTFPGSTDGQGKDSLDLKFLSVDEPRPYSLAATASVSDVNRQTWSSRSTLLVHPASHYVGIKARRTFVEAGQPLQYQVIVTDLDGKAVAGREVELKVNRLSWDRRIGKKEVFSQHLTSANGPLSVSVPTGEGGVYQLEALVSDPARRSNRSQLTCWVAGGRQPRARQVEMEPLTLVPDKKVYQPGEVAEILVQSPSPGAHALVTLERHGLVSHQLLDLNSGSATLRVPLEEDYLPNLHVTVDAVGQEARTDESGNPLPKAPTRPMQARGSLNLEISKRSRELSVEVKARHPKAAPGSNNLLEVTVKDAAGQPVANSEVALLVVDESVLALIGGEYANPLELFYPARAAQVVHVGMRQWIELALAGEVEPPPPIPSTGGWTSSTGAPGAVNVSFEEAFQGALALPLSQAFPLGIGTFSRTTPIRLRSDFAPLALFKPALQTDAQGKARVVFKLPDNLTRYRIVALAAAGDRCFGKGQSTLVARQPLMVRPSPPRFLNFGDRCELPVVVHNQTDRPLPVRLACRTSNLKLDPARAGVSLTVPANDRVEVGFPVSAEQPGRGRLQVAVSSGDFADAADVDFPVWTPATTEAVASYGVIDEQGICQPVAPPADVFRQFGGLEVSTSSTALAELTDAFLYLQSYPYECAEQVSSRVLSTVALAPVLRAFEAPGIPGEQALKVSLAADIKKLEGLQNSDGGWDTWERGRPSVPFCSLHVAHALVRLRQAGHQVADSTCKRALEYTAHIGTHIPADYPEWCKHHLRSYALYILHRAGQPEVAAARQLLKECGGVGQASLEALGWLLPTLSRQPEGEAIRRHLNNRVSESASTAQFTTRYEEGAQLVLASEHRADAVLLEALIEDSPDSDLLPKLVRGLLDRRVRGRWANTQENCFVLLALHEYFQKFEKVTPDFVARLWLGERCAGEQPFHGRSANSQDVRVPMAELNGRQDLRLSKEGSGRLYYRLGLKYAPLQLDLPALERGFSVQRQYEAADDNGDVLHRADGSWHIKSGARVKVTLTMVAPTVRYQVALVDPLPAGLEALNPALRASPASGWNARWYEHENLRDERVEAFTSRLYEGVHVYSYYARATTPGSFVVPPATAEEMYHPETFGRSASDRVTVDP